MIVYSYANLHPLYNFARFSLLHTFHFLLDVVFCLGVTGFKCHIFVCEGKFGVDSDISADVSQYPVSMPICGE